MNYFAIASLKSYLFVLLVWAIIIAIIAPLVLALFTRKRVFIFVVGLLIVFGAVPAGGMLEASVNFQETRIWGIGYLLMLVMAVIGIVTMVFSKKLAKK